MKERILFIDLAKTIGIYLVIVGHYVWYMDIPFGNTAAVWNMAYFVTLFHMPLFFIISGMLFNVRDNKTQLTKCCRQILLPYFLITGICLLLGTLLDYANGVFSIRILIRNLLGIFSGGDFYGRGTLDYSGPMWFCISIFMIRLMVNFIYTEERKNFILLLAFVIYCCGIYIGDKLPMRIDSSMIGLMFFYIGFRFKKTFLSIQDNPKWKNLIFVLCSFGILVVCSEYSLDYSLPQSHLSINAMKFGNYPFLFIFSGIAGTLLICCISRILSFKGRFIERVSNGTIVVLGFHQLLMLACKKWMDSANVLFVLAFSFCILLFCYVLILISKKYFPAILGFRN